MKALLTKWKQQPIQQERRVTFEPPASPLSIQSDTSSYIALPSSWSQQVGPDLVANLSPQERNRQEVLFEIVSSEQRYVDDLLEINDVFIRNLLPNSATPTPRIDFDPTDPDDTTYSGRLSRQRSLRSASVSASSAASPAFTDISRDVDLPIAARYTASAGAGASDSSSSIAPPVTPEDYPSSLFVGGAANALVNTPLDKKTSIVSMRHQSLPPLSRTSSNLYPAFGSRNSSRVSCHPPSSFNKLHRHLSAVSPALMPEELAKSKELFQLPKDLEIVLKALAGGVLEGHVRLVKALKKRYDDEFPLVRSLADIFTQHCAMFKEYSKYVMHLEKALGQIDQAQSFYDPSHLGKRSSKNISTSLLHLSKHLNLLDTYASSLALPSLSISLSKPFNRLLHYPLMFQNLLFQTDPSLFEYEDTLGMVEVVEGIVRELEDDRIGWEEREKTRDAWARIGGLDGDKVLMAPKPHRLLIAETHLASISDAQSKLASLNVNLDKLKKHKTKLRTRFKPPVTNAIRVQIEKGEEDQGVKPRRSIRRLSSILGSKPESADSIAKSGIDNLWIVRFTDVSLLCEKTDTTSLPLSTIVHPDFTGPGGMTRKNKDKEQEERDRRGRARRGNERNMYEFLKVWEWHPDQDTGETKGTDKPQERPSSPPSRSTSVPTLATNSDIISCRGDGRSDAHLRHPLTHPSMPPFATKYTAPQKLTPSKVRSLNNLYSSSSSSRSFEQTLRYADTDEEDGWSEEESVMSFAYVKDALIPTGKQTTRVERSPSRAGVDATSGRNGKNGLGLGTTALRIKPRDPSAPTTGNGNVRPRPSSTSTKPSRVNTAFANTTGFSGQLTQRNQTAQSNQNTIKPVKRLSNAIPSEAQTAKFSTRLRPLSSDGAAFAGTGVAERTMSPSSLVGGARARGSLPPSMLSSRCASATSGVINASSVPSRNPRVGGKEESEGEDLGTIRSSRAYHIRPRPAWDGATIDTVKLGERASTPASVASGGRTTLRHSSAPVTSSTATAVGNGTVDKGALIEAKIGMGRKPRVRGSMPPLCTARGTIGIAGLGTSGGKVSAATAARLARQSSSGTSTRPRPSIKPSAVSLTAATTSNLRKKHSNASSPTSSTFSFPSAPASTGPIGSSDANSTVKTAPRTSASSPSVPPNSKSPLSTTTTQKLTKSSTTLKSMQSTDSGLIEIWRQYGNVDIDKLGSSTPKKPLLNSTKGAAMGGEGNTGGAKKVSSMAGGVSAPKTKPSPRLSAVTLASAPTTRTGLNKRETPSSLRTSVEMVTGPGTRRRDLGEQI
ncbi:uncharacterized protein L203_102329 [Cryptococcus depauperatus CBS 7841]|uniref:Uncharacterized protein n=1 Tax=Cryptococcus depauperatus CBS 7841 TaxID=1295531 RepID=A0A1E3IC85_9TREE|nr:hypothetical protein L203_04785 [Cryptococcus depauperatus CBS 7841]